ncbi:5'/3'-nucleotidase SurE [Amycolatopsis sp. NBC_00348]|uniref:5'/3'-nucleotidase SurE n=1 Tax=Amycolatopsis sp. NBC_00348 TaxID=2975956 RepID=UPI003FA4BC9E
MTTAAGDTRRVAVERREVPGLAGVPVHAAAAHQGLIALPAAWGVRRAAGGGAVGSAPRANIGRAVLHSGTVGASLTASLHGARELAESLDVALDDETDPHWDTAVAACRSAEASRAGRVRHRTSPRRGHRRRHDRAVGRTGRGLSDTGQRCRAAGRRPRDDHRAALGRGGP